MTSPAPAPVQSAQTMRLPDGSSRGVSGWTISRRCPSRLWSFAVAQTQPTTRPRNMGSSFVEADVVDDADDRRIDRRVFAAFRHARRGAGDSDHRLAVACADRV